MTKATRRKWKLPILILLGMFGVAVSVMVGCPGPSGGAELEGKVVKIREHMKPLESVADGDYDPAITTYFEYYGLDFEARIPDVEHIFGTFKSGDETLAAHVYRPVDYKATIVLLHGYMNHTGQLKHLIGHLLEYNYAVVVYDMPGHGLSTGEKAAIDDFSRYSRSLVDCIDAVGGMTEGPYHLIGFSTGGSAAIDYLLTEKGTFFERVILTAPLVRNVAWQSSKAGYKLYSNFAETIPRGSRRNSSDKEYLKFNKYKDVLHSQNVSLKWVEALHEWNDKIVDAEPCDRPVKVIQGNKDTTVMYKYNLKFIKKKFTDVDVTMIDGGRHELYNESKQLRDKVLDRVIEYLEE